MIKVTKGKEPQVLVDNKAKWTNDLINLVKKYGSYDAIPKNEKNCIISNYAHPEIAAALLGRGGKAKCIYCESYVNVTGYANIEHYHPKSLYPDETFSWDNLFVGCALCNIPKSNFDTSKKPFVHPVNDNPEEYLTFDELNYAPKHSTGIAYEKANNLIKACKLNERIALVREHANLLCAFWDTRNKIVEKIVHYKSVKTEKKKIDDAQDLLRSLMVLKDEASDESHYAGYMRYLLRKYPEVAEAVNIVNNHKDDLGLPLGFCWSFKF